MPGRKSTKKQARYTETPTKSQGLCRDCTMFRPPAACTAVAGPIKPYAHCEFFKSKRGRYA